MQDDILCSVLAILSKQFKGTLSGSQLITPTALYFVLQTLLVCDIALWISFISVKPLNKVSLTATMYLSIKFSIENGVGKV